MILTLPEPTPVLTAAARLTSEQGVHAAEVQPHYLAGLPARDARQGRALPLSGLVHLAVISFISAIDTDQGWLHKVFVTIAQGEA